METGWESERAKEQLKTEGRSHKWLADKIGTSPAYVSHLLNGRANPSLSKIKLIAMFLNCSEEYLTGESDDPKAEPLRFAR